MKHELKAPNVGESITEVIVARWLKKNGEAVKNGDPVLEIESEKASLEIVAEADGVLETAAQEGDTVNIGDVVAYIDDAAEPTVKPDAEAEKAAPKKPESVAEKAPQPAAEGQTGKGRPLPGPAARKLAEEKGVKLDDVPGTGRDGRVTKGDIIGYLEKGPAAKSAAAAQPVTQADERTRRVPMSLLRRKIAERLVAAQQTAAILTTFNEVDMTAVMETRKKHKESFQKKWGAKLGFMSFFTRACALALRDHEKVNASIDGNDIVYHDYQDIGIAVGTPRGLVVPIIRDSGERNLGDIETEIGRLASKARDGKLTIADMSGGTFTISNGGVYGSLLSTPILTPPQCAILGMHKIEERPKVVDGKIEIRPMMYLAVSYDHRLLDGKNAVEFLVSIKNYLENPETMDLLF